MSLRERGDYGGGRHVSREEAQEAVARAARIFEQVRSAFPELFKADASADLFEDFAGEKDNP